MRRRPRAGRRLGVGYVVHSYPALSHAFVQREVLELRRLGRPVETLSIHRAPPQVLRSEADRAEAARTEWILPPRFTRIALMHLRALVLHPSAYFATVGTALRSSPPGLRALLWQLFYFAEAVIVWDFARRHGLRHLHAHLANVATDAAWLATELGRRCDPAGGWLWSFTMHGSTEFFEVSRFNLARKVVAADLVACVSYFTRSQLMSLVDRQHWSKLRVVHCGADLRRYRYREPKSGSGDALRVLHVGRLVSVKGQSLLLEATAALVNRGVDVEVTIVGTGPLERDLHVQAAQLGIAPRVQLPGPLGQDELPKVFARHDVFCLTSFAEGVPVVVMEAMASGLPVVAPRITGIPELVSHGESGLLVTPGRVDELADALETLFRDPGLRIRLARNAREVIEADFDAAKCAEQLDELFTVLHASAAGQG